MIFNMGDGGSGAKSDITAHKNKNLRLVGTVPSVLKVNAVEGESVQNGTPTPAVPVDINSVVVSEIKTCGKNLQYNSATYDGWNKYNNGGTITDETYNGGKVVKYTASWNFLYPQNRLFKAGTYTISFDAKVKAKGSVCIGNVGGLGVSKVFDFSSTNYSRYSYTFTLSEDKEGYVVPFIPSNSTVGELYIANMQVEKSPLMSDYEPYTESKITLSAPITLRGVNDVKDAICKQNGVYGVLRNFDSITLNGSEYWELISASNPGRIYTSIFNKTIKKVANNNTKATWVICSHYGVSARNNILENTLTIESNGNVVFRDDINAEKPSVWKAWLSANNVTVDYQLATPVFEPLPEADQIALKQLETFDKITNVFTDSEVEPVIEVECATSKTGGLLFDVESDMGGCKLKYENGKFYIGYDDGTVETEV